MIVTATTTTSRIRATVLALGIGAVLALTGCGASEDDAPTDQASGGTAAEVEEAAPEDAEPEEDTTVEEAPSDEAVGEGSAEVAIDGSPVDIADATVVCQEADGTMTIAVGSAAGTDGIGAVLEGETVKSVALGSVDGAAMGWAEGAPGEVTATVEGLNYTISGEMMAVDAANPSAPTETPFEMQITCP